MQGTQGSVSGPERFHMQEGGKDAKPVHHNCWAHTLELHRTGEATAQLEGSPCLPELEKAFMQQLRPGAAINQLINWK